MREVPVRRYVAINVRRRREALRLSQEALAETCGLYRSYLGRIERAEFDVTIGTLAKLAAGLGVETYVLLRPPPKNARSKPIPRGPKPGQKRRASRN